MMITNPSSLSVPSLYLSNWDDLVAIWMASTRAQTDSSNAGPRLGELHLLDGAANARAVNQIVDSTGFFRDETNGLAYLDAHRFLTEAYFESRGETAGVLTTRYVSFGGAALPVDLRRCYFAVPGQPFFVVVYRITNPSAAPITFNLLDQVHLANAAGGDPARRVHAWYDRQRNALVGDMTASGQSFVVLGAFDPVDSYQAADDADHAPGSPTASGWTRFASGGSLPNNADVRASDVSLAFQKRVTVAPGATASVAFYLTVRRSVSEALAASDAARARPADAWQTDASAKYSSWLESGGARVANLPDDGVNEAFRRIMVLVKNAQNPELGTFPAATNPISYGHKTWVRDASVTAMALDACGHFDEAALYWRWMASVQASDGSWKTTYSYWDGSYLPFVEPEYDSVGTFLYGVCRHYLSTGDASFLRDLWPAVQRSADFVLTNIQSNGFGAADFSIWEEGQFAEHATYTQSWYVAGLYAVQALAELRGDPDLADWYAGGAASIMTAFQRPSDASPPGAYNAAGKYYNRAVRTNGGVNDTVDSSSNVGVAMGVFDLASGRARAHLAKTTSTLACSRWGLARYLHDDFYYTNVWSPAGNEVLDYSPAWPQMSMWLAVCDAVSRSSDALSRLQWFCSTMGVGYTPQGEAVSNVTGHSVLSSMSEPLTASSFLIACLSAQGLLVLPVRPPIYNAGARKTIPVRFGTAGDWDAWSNVPYFVPAPPPAMTPPAPTNLTIARVYATNDDAFIYLRVDNVAGSLPAYAATPGFAVRVYTGDFAGGSAESLPLAFDGNGLPRPASFMVERGNLSDGYARYLSTAGQWRSMGGVDGALAPQWDPALGRVEIVIPIGAVSNGPPAWGGWTYVVVALGALDASGRINEVHRAVLHYRLTGSEPWIYGNMDLA
jgi:hypothetical protein